MRIRPETSQIATILTLVMAAIFLFIVITINIGNIAQEKTMVSNVSDNAALLLASMLGSLSNGLRMKIGLWHDKDKDCDLDWLMVKLITAVIGLIVSIVLVIVAPPVGIAGVAFAVLSIAGFAAAFVGGVLTAVQEPGSFKQAALQFQNMTFEERLKETGIQTALYSLVSDPNKNCVNRSCLTTGGGDPALYGGCSDPQDLDMDGKTDGDCIGCFAYWYTERLRGLPRKGDVVQDIFNALFFNPRLLKEGEEPPIPIIGKLPRIYVKRDEESWQAASYGFWIDTNKNLLADPNGNLTMHPPIDTDDHKDPVGVVYQHDIYFVDWLEGRFTRLAERLFNYGYGLNAIWYKETPMGKGQVKKEGTKYDIEFLTKEIKEFEDGVAELYGSDFDSRLLSFEEWMPIFYNGEPKQDWTDRMQQWINKAETWINTLEARRDAINTCVFNTCWAPGPYQCGYGSGECCKSHCECDCYPCPSEGDGGAALFHDSNVKASLALFRNGSEKVLLADNYGCSCPDCGSCECICDARCGCNPAGRFGGQLCPSGRCKPQMPCTTPADGGKGGADTPCCTIADNGLYYQLCDPTPHSDGGNGPCDGPCTDTYYDCGFNPSNNVITREHAVEYLKQFVVDVKALMAAFKKGYEDAKLKESDPRLYEALYEWEDYAGRRGEPTSQRVKHAVYVRLSDHLRPNEKDPEKGFQIPYPNTYREWGWPSFGNRKCTEIAKEKGEFGMVVGRYDQDVGTAKASPFRNLWVFKTRAKPSGTEPAFPLSYIDPKAEVTETARKFVLQNGMVSATKAYYGPGYTFKKDELKERDPNILKAYKFNRDIKIERAKWTDFIK